MTTMTNGSQSPSKFLSHVTSYPVVSDTLETFKSHPYGKKSLELADGAYQKFGKPVEPYLETPYSYAKPYVAKADELADSGLQKVDGRFPIVKEETSTVVETGKSYVFWPYNYLYGTYSEEYRKTTSHNDAGPGLFTLIKAVLSTELKIASDAFQLIADILGPKYEGSKKKGSDYIRQGQDAAKHYKSAGQQKVSEYSKMGQEKMDEFGEKAGQAKEEGKAQAEKAKGQAKEAKEEGKAKAGAK